MGSKAFLFLGFCLAIFIMISSEVFARELSETSTTSIEDSKKFNSRGSDYPATPIGGGGYPAGGGGYPSGGGGGYPSGERGGGGRGGGGGYCRYGCCGRRNYNGCSRCCSYKG